ncbi:MAG: DUF1080 domain-containing protein [Planctomycetes bacterium]|nr:DUF1080 domain-containing protein [Planctomycetota bacterium]
MVAGILSAGAAEPARPTAPADAEGWISLFDGKTLDGWKVSENSASIRVADGAIVMDGPRAHAFYVGPVRDHNFKNFEFACEVLTAPGANSGVYFHTAWQDAGYPAKGHEAQVNNTHKDPRKTGSLYAVVDTSESPAKDNEWFALHVTVKGRQITLKVGGKTTVDYTEPEGYKHPSRPGRGLSSGTFALQGHDPESKVRFRNLRVRPLPD